MPRRRGAGARRRQAVRPGSAIGVERAVDRVKCRRRVDAVGNLPCSDGSFDQGQISVAVGLQELVAERAADARVVLGLPDEGGQDLAGLIDAEKEIER
jgi:hypothetical protein